jgi:hypothetical protein
MGPYCQYCDQRCFLPRTVNGRSLILATCPSGMANDRAKLRGHDHRTTLNPVTGEIDLKIRLRQHDRTERACEHTRCVRGRGEGERIPAGEQYAVVTRLEDRHDLARRFHLECLTDLFGLTADVATPTDHTAPQP